VTQVLELLSMLSKKNERFLRKTINKLSDRFYTLGSDNLSSMGLSQVLFVLCRGGINEEIVFLEFASLLKKNKDLDFVKAMIDTLTAAMAADTYFESLRMKLRGKRPLEVCHSKEQFLAFLFPAWTVSPVSTLTLCLITRNYKLAYNLIFRFAFIESDTNTLCSLGNLVQLIESPSFKSKFF